MIEGAVLLTTLFYLPTTIRYSFMHKKKKSVPLKKMKILTNFLEIQSCTNKSFEYSINWL